MKITHINAHKLHKMFVKTLLKRLLCISIHQYDIITTIQLHYFIVGIKVGATAKEADDTKVIGNVVFNALSPATVNGRLEITNFMYEGAFDMFYTTNLVATGKD